MERLTGLDAGFLYSETPSLHMHTIKVAVVEPTGGAAGGGGPGWYSFERFRDTLAANIHRLPPFRRRLLSVPLGIDHPRWIEDRTFDIDRHLLRATAAAPGGPRELAALVSESAGKQLDRSRPLWEITAVEGLAHGRVGFIAKIHHAVADGGAANELLMNILELETGALPRAPLASVAPWQPEDAPSSLELLRDGSRHLARRVGGLPSLVAGPARSVRALAAHVRSSDVAGAVPFKTPATPFNRALTPRRTFATAELPLSELRAVRRATGVTLNDVFLSVCAGALRRYLTRRSALPDRPLVAGVPSSTALGERGRLHGNRVSNLFGLLPTHIADPLERVAVVHAAMEEAKRRQAALGPEMLASWAEYAAPFPYATMMRAWSRSGMASRVVPPINLVVSSVPGPPSPLCLGAVRLASIHSIGPILEGVGLNITAWSYVDRLLVGFLACPEHVPDPWLLVDDLEASHAELLHAAGEASAA
jgi:diacylglycerol O-acyltransferase / wax synthase